MKLRTFEIRRLLPCILVSDTWYGTRIILILARRLQLPELVNIHYGHVDPRLGCMESEPTSERGATYKPQEPCLHSSESSLLERKLLEVSYLML